MTTLPPLYVGAAMTAQTVQPVPKVTFPFDAALDNTPPMGAFTGVQEVTSAFAAWQQQIEAEVLVDFALDYRTLRMRSNDGAIYRDENIDGGLAYTPRAINQLCSVLTQGRERPGQVANNLTFYGSHEYGYAARVTMFREQCDRSLRKSSKAVVFRTYLTTVKGWLTRCIRAAHSTIHAGKFTDDLAVMAQLRNVLRSNASCGVTRTVDLTHGWATLGEPTAMLQRSLHWSNSETGAASLSFGAGAVLRLVDATVQFPNSRGDVTVDEIVTLADKQSRTRMRHTVPAGTDAEKAAIANQRMVERISNAITYGEQLEAAWKRALVDVPYELSRSVPTDVDLAIEALLDAVEGTHGMEADDRAKLATVLKDDKRLTSVTHGSAAHVAAAFAVLGKKAGTMAESIRLQDIAGRWVMEGWRK